MKIYHNPRCSKSRQTLVLLEENNVSPEIVLYLETAPDKKELRILCQQLGCSPTEIIRFKEDLAKEIGINKNDQRDDEEWFGILASNPKLLERPIVTDGNRAVVGRPPENVLELIDS
jgi:arsenate reductase